MVTTVDDDVALDFGDAPTAAESGFGKGYPTKLADDGARHVSGPLALGTAKDIESDGSHTGDTYARFRISSAGGLTPTGQANDGEVDNAPRLPEGFSSRTWLSTDASGAFATSRNWTIRFRPWTKYSQYGSDSLLILRASIELLLRKK